MDAFEFEWQTTDQLTIKGKCWLSKDIENTPPRAVICLVHGFGEHIQRYEHVAQFFNQHNLIFLGADLRGHGHSEGKKGYISRYEVFMQDVGQLVALTSEKFPSLPIILYGHSMGGNLAANFALRFQPEQVKGVLLTSPWLRLTQKPPALKVALGKLVIQFLPSFTDTAPLNEKDLSTDLEVGRKYKADPLVHNRMGARTFIDVVAAGEWAIEQAQAFKHPLLLMHGKDDNITSYLASEEFAQKVEGDKTVELWEGLRHELHNEVKKEEVLQKMLTWIEGVLG